MRRRLDGIYLYSELVTSSSLLRLQLSGIRLLEWCFTLIFQAFDGNASGVD